MNKNKFFLSLVLGLGLFAVAGCGGSDSAAVNGEQTAEQSKEIFAGLPWKINQNGVYGVWNTTDQTEVWFVEQNQVTLAGLCGDLTAKVVSSATINQNSITIDSAQKSSVTNANGGSCSVELQAGTYNFQIMQGQTEDGRTVEVLVVEAGGNQKQLVRTEVTAGNGNNNGGNDNANNNNNGGGNGLPGGGGNNFPGGGNGFPF